MKHRIHILLFSILFPVSIFSTGFGAGTYVQTSDGFISIENLVIGNEVRCYQENLCSVLAVRSYAHDCLVAITIGNDTIQAAVDQLFYVEAIGWKQAIDLKVGDRLATRSGYSISIQDVSFVSEQILIYSISLPQPHIFYIEPHGIVVHNGVPVAVGLSFAFDTFIAGSVKFLGASIVAGIATLGSYCGIKFFKKCRTSIIADPLPINQRCFEPVQPPSQLPTKKPCGNELLPLPSNLITAPSSEQQDGIICQLVVHPVLPSIVNTQSSAENVKPRYNGPYARNWNEFKTECPVGKIHGNKFVNTGKQNPKDGGPLYQILQDIPGAEMFKQGHIVALDRLHHDHMEVWSTKGKWIGVANLDGSRNISKTEQGKREGNRDINV